MFQHIETMVGFICRILTISSNQVVRVVPLRFGYDYLEVSAERIQAIDSARENSTQIRSGEEGQNYLALFILEDGTNRVLLISLNCYRKRTASTSYRRRDITLSDGHTSLGLSR